MNSMLLRLLPRENPPPKDADASTKRLPKPGVLRILSNWAGHQIDVRELRRLLAMDQRILSDIGLDRSDLLAEYRRLSTMSWTTRVGHTRKRLFEQEADASPTASADQGTHSQRDNGLGEAYFAMQRRRR